MPFNLAKDYDYSKQKDINKYFTENLNNISKISGSSTG